ncbi:SpoIIE family protein phosphatase [Pedobacter sp. MC2016-14]|uniref:SpoIIE family protein phosphatase n=1 Tax=Pedobacter sp. MC2016-14 TaxID=2897327 RepID=UPI001E37DB19|nr:ATP-binding protein [Pedobacter sp. MC2016-14]MCD0488176.1 SpoIIE family protein phosphatase [Pedobacter sp. MC2016-14]
MVNENYVSYPATDRSYYALLRKGIHKQALTAGFDDKKLAHLDIIVAEITTNIFKHTSGAEILCGVMGQGKHQYIEIISIDDGPGFTDLPNMLLDGVSSVNTLGHGLGSIKRLSDFFGIYSQKGWGTVLVARLHKQEYKEDLHPIVVTSLVVAKPSEIESGDGCMYKSSERYFKLFLMDGLGHGPEAHQAVMEGFNAFKLCPYHDPAEIIRYMHNPLKRSRGGVGTVVVYDNASRKIEILGVGNISTKLVGNVDSRNIMSYNGIIGHNIPNTMKSQEVNARDFKFIILCSDGIKSRWDISKYPMILRYDPTIIAAAIYKDFARKTDDMSVVIIKTQNL